MPNFSIMKKLVFTLILLFSFTSFAQDFDDWDDFSSEGESFGKSNISLSFSGEAELQARLYLDKPEMENSNYASIGDFPVTASPSAKLGVAFSGRNVDAEINLKFDMETLKDYQEDILDEFTIRGYFGKLKLEAGKMKVVWGKGDKLHVLDNFNADDYTDFIIPDYLDRRISTPMFRAVYSFDKNDLRLEGIWTPFMESDRFASEGIWLPSAYSQLESTVTEVVSNQAMKSVSSLDFSGLIKAFQFDQDSLYPNTRKLKYTQAGLRLTGTIGSFDLGASYYYGHYKQVSANLSRTILESELPSLDYDMKQTFGLEAATVIWRFNLRGEAAYNLTEDVKGDDPWTHNNSIAWLFGFDIDLPISNINVNIQETGEVILNNRKIKNSVFSYFDVDYDSKGYTNDKIVLDITDSWLNDKIVPEILFLWGIERGDFVLQPKIEYRPNGYLSLALSGLWIYCIDKESEFYDWRNNSFINVGIKCMF